MTVRGKKERVALWEDDYYAYKIWQSHNPGGLSFESVVRGESD